MMKRRVIYMDDETWARATEEAARYDHSISAHFRARIIGGRVIPISLRDDMARVEAERFNSRPFRPVPKGK